VQTTLCQVRVQSHTPLDLFSLSQRTVEPPVQFGDFALRKILKRQACADVDTFRFAGLLIARVSMPATLPGTRYATKHPE
jgi:hypothetical protein